MRDESQVIGVNYPFTGGCGICNKLIPNHWEANIARLHGIKKGTQHYKILSKLKGLENSSASLPAMVAGSTTLVLSIIGGNYNK